MREKIVAGNWKMNLTRREAISLTKEILDSLDDNIIPNIILSPPFVYLHEIQQMSKNITKIKIASQDISILEKGSFTGEVSSLMISSLSIDYTILGHSERRELLKEDNLHIRKKVDLAIKNNLKVIFCCGETEIHRSRQVHFDWIRTQISESLFHLSPDFLTNIIIAYEPIWAIGTGLTASPDQAEEMHKFIREIFTKKYGQDISQDISIIYGGSCNSLNAKELFSQSNIDGGLIGGASLDAKSFNEIIKSF